MFFIASVIKLNPNQAQPYLSIVRLLSYVVWCMSPTHWFLLPPSMVFMVFQSSFFIYSLPPPFPLPPPPHVSVALKCCFES